MTKSLLLFLVALGTATACSQESPVSRAPDASSYRALATPERNHLARRCGFGDTLLFTGTQLADREEWYGGQLRAMGERRICPTPNRPAEVYRLDWLPTFHPAVAVRVERDESGERVLTAKILSGAGGYAPGMLARTSVVRLTEAEWVEFAGLVGAARFWDSPTEPPPSSSVGVDGSQWVVEGLASDRYHVVDRWSPGQDGPDARFRALGEWMLARSGLVPAALVRMY